MQPSNRQVWAGFALTSLLLLLISGAVAYAAEPTETVGVIQQSVPWSIDGTVTVDDTEAVRVFITNWPETADTSVAADVRIVDITERWKVDLALWLGFCMLLIGGVVGYAWVTWRS